MRAVNLIPSDQRRSGVSVGVGAGHSGGAAYAVLGVVLAAAVLAFLYGHAKHQITSRNGEVASLQAKAQTLQSEVSSLSPYTSFIQLRESRTQAVASLVDSRFDWAHAFHELGRVLPQNIAISSLDGTVGGSTAAAEASPSSSAASSASAASTTTSATPPGSVPIFTLAGCATSQRAVANMLQRLRLIDGVSEVTLQSSSKGGGGSAGGGSCASDQPSFAATVTFQALPSTSAAAGAATGKSTTVSSSTSSATGGAQ